MDSLQLYPNRQLLFELWNVFYIFFIDSVMCERKYVLCVKGESVCVCVCVSVIKHVCTI